MKTLKDIDFGKAIKALSLADNAAVMVEDEEEILPDGEMVETETVEVDEPVEGEGLSPEQAKALLEEMAPVLQQLLDGFSVVLEKLGVKTPAESEMSVEEMTDKAMIKLNELMLRPTIEDANKKQKQVELSDLKVREQKAILAVEKAIEEGKIFESNKDWAIGLATRNMKEFNDTYANDNAPKLVPDNSAVKDIDNANKKTDKENTVQFALTDWQKKLSKQMGYTKEEEQKIFNPNYKKPEQA